MKRVWLAVSISVASACAPKLDLARAVAAESVTTGWVDGGTVAGKNKIVPAVSFRLKNMSKQKIGAVQVNAVFRRVNDAGEWSSAFVPNVARGNRPGRRDRRAHGRGAAGLHRHRRLRRDAAQLRISSTRRRNCS